MNSKISREQILDIIDAAQWAPSGDNCQPWSFQWDGQLLEIFHNSLRAEHPLNPQNISSMLTLGCLLEIICIASREHGFEAKLTIHGGQNEPVERWASIEFALSTQAASPLYASIRQRATDRREFRGGHISLTDMEYLNQLCEAYRPAKIHFEPAENSELQNYILEAEKVIYSHPNILPKLLQWTRLSKRESNKTKDGLPWRNLGINVWELPMIRLLRKYNPLMKPLKPVLVQKHLAMTKKLLTTSAGIFCFSIPVGNNCSIIQAGRYFMHCWLFLTQNGFGVQPLTLSTNLIFAAQNNLLDHTWNAYWKEFFKNGEGVVKRAFSIPEHHLPIWMMRTGVSTPLPNELRTLRRSALEVTRFVNK